ncbi:hypothetical protein GSI_05000 [Ganoderma sinense ZZ0214-1]|uniref:F-box domain-containing protein n=1 Tax=Ganoderma sinense ZZ0214-1 TaxID=1077348 RepID=A0A2G8SGK2_9APHY|nr:hypothetical protein GSI_05000 [Ganoderma sinense ZZ0214-1]
MEASPQRTVAKMMRTCRALRDNGARIVLGGGASLRTEDHVLSFVQFLRADPTSRIQHLRDLDIGCGELPRCTADELLWLITSPLLALDSLALRKADSLLKSNISPSELTSDGDLNVLVTALAQLTTVRHLKVSQCDNQACTLVRTICSPLKTISVHFPSDGPRNGDEAESRNPILLLAKHSATLEEISGSHFAMLQPHIIYDEVFPCVRRLSASYDAVWCHRTRAHVHAFPNLTHLRLSFADRGHVGVYHDTFPTTRALRRRIWNRESLDAVTPRPAWKKLEELRGAVTDVLALGMASHVPMLRLVGMVMPRAFRHVSTILEDLLPTGLAIAVAGALTFQERMGTLLSGPAAQQIRELELEVVFSAAEGDMDIHAVLVRSFFMTLSRRRKETVLMATLPTR